jgi:hypothetical protein
MYPFDPLPGMSRNKFVHFSPQELGKPSYQKKDVHVLLKSLLCKLSECIDIRGATAVGLVDLRSGAPLYPLDVTEKGAQKCQLIAVPFGEATHQPIEFAPRTPGCWWCACEGFLVPPLYPARLPPLQYSLISPATGKELVPPMIQTNGCFEPWCTPVKECASLGWACFVPSVEDVMGIVLFFHDFGEEPTLPPSTVCGRLESSGFHINLDNEADDMLVGPPDGVPADGDDNDDDDEALMDFAVGPCIYQEF